MIVSNIGSLTNFFNFMRMLTNSLFIKPKRLLESGWLGHIPFAHWLIDILRPSVFVELGTHRGISYCAFCEAVKELQLETKCYAVDHWEGEEHAGLYGEDIYHEFLDFHDASYTGFSRLIRTSFDDAVQYFSDGSVDLLHIDGFHSYEAVSHDYATWLPKLSDRAVVIFHDINVRERGFGVWRFWDEISSKYPSFSFLHCNGLGVLGVGKALSGEIKEFFDTDKDFHLANQIRHVFSYLGSYSEEYVDNRIVKKRMIQMLEESKLSLMESVTALQTVNDSQQLEIEHRQRVRLVELTQIQALKSSMEDQRRSFNETLNEYRTELTSRETTIKRLAAKIEKLDSVNLETFIAVLRQSLSNTFIGKKNRLRQIFTTNWRALFKLTRAELDLLDIIAEKKFFDHPYYCNQINNSNLNYIEAVLHYLAVGATEGKKPHPLFDTKYYLEQYPDVKEKAENPLLHFVRIGLSELRNPNRFFDSKYYVKRNPDILNLGVDPITHYLLCGAKNNCSPHPLFDISYYLENNPDVKNSNIEALGHFLDYGDAEHRSPCLLFDSAYYVDQLSDKYEEKVLPLDHFCKTAHELKLNPNPLFDTEFYLKNNPQLIDLKINPLIDYKTKWRPLFSCNWRNDTKNPHPLFINSQYLAGNKDIESSDLDPLSHFFISCAENQQGTGKRGTNQFGISSLSLAVADTLKMTRIDLPVSSYISEISIVKRKVPTVSIIIPVYNKIQYTLRCLNSIAQNSRDCSFPYEIIVIDDCSSDETGKFLKKIKNLVYIRNDENLGFLGSCNKAATQARGDYIVFLNNDTVVMWKWLSALYNTFKTERNVGLVGSQLLYPSGKLQEAGGIIWPDASGWNFGKNQVPDDFQYSYLRDVDYCSGACIMIPKILWNKVGGFDELYSPAYYEDVDLAFKVRESGSRVLYQPSSRIIHFEGISCSKSIETGVKRYQVINKEKFLNKWAETIKTFANQSEPSKLWLDRSKGKHLLMIDCHVPTPDKDAGSVIQVEYLKIFKELGYSITFLSDNLRFYSPYTQAMEKMGIECAYVPFVQDINDFYKKRGGDFDLVMIYRVDVALRHIPFVREHCSQAKIIFNTVDLHFLRLQREAELKNSSELFSRALEVKAMELKAIKDSDASIVLNTREVELLKEEMPEAKVEFVPIGQEVKGLLAPYPELKDFVFIGGFAHPPNVDAVQYLAQEIWPLVRKELPDAKMVIVGSAVTDEVKKCAGNGIEIKGFVKDIEEVFRTYRVTIAPLRYGAGMKGKVVSSMCYGIPGVITPIAAEGIGAENGEQLVIADTAEDFAAGMISLYTNTDMWNAMSQSGLEHARQHLSCDTVRRKLEGLLSSIVTIQDFRLD